MLFPLDRPPFLLQALLRPTWQFSFTGERLVAWRGLEGIGLTRWGPGRYSVTQRILEDGELVDYSLRSDPYGHHVETYEITYESVGCFTFDSWTHAKGKFAHEWVLENPAEFLSQVHPGMRLLARVYIQLLKQ